MNIRPTLASAAVSLSLAIPAAALADPLGNPTATATLSPAPAAPVAASAAAVAVRDFDVYVDLQTGFAFVKTPERWTFVRKLEAAQLKALPASTLTALAVDGASGALIGMRFAQAPEDRRAAAL